MKAPFITASALALSALGSAALAQEAPAPSAPWQVSGTATLASDYLFKGMTQTWNRPALQAGIDLTTEAGFSAGLWASNVSPKVYAGAHLEIDVSLGYRHALNQDWAVGGGLLSVFYPGGNYNKVRYAPLPSQRYDFTEANLFVAYKWVTLKYSRTLTDLLGFNAGTGYTGGTRGSAYLDLSADVPLAEGYVLNLHAGHQNVTADLAAPTAGGSRNPDFNDYRIALTRSFAQGLSATAGVAWNSNRAFFDATPSNHDLADTRDVGKRRFFVSVSKAF